MKFMFGLDLSGAVKMLVNTFLTKKTREEYGIDDNIINSVFNILDASESERKKMIGNLINATLTNHQDKLATALLHLEKKYNAPIHFSIARVPIPDSNQSVVGVTIFYFSNTNLPVVNLPIVVHQMLFSEIYDYIVSIIDENEQVAQKPLLIDESNVEKKDN